MDVEAKMIYLECTLNVSHQPALEKLRLLTINYSVGCYGINAVQDFYNIVSHITQLLKSYF